jgi:predicted ATPase
MTCLCQRHHQRKRVVLTGGPGAGKTAVLELVRQHLCEHVVLLPQAAAILFRGGLMRGATNHERRAVQRAIYHLQCELEATVDEAHEPSLVICDRGTVDGCAYWPGPETLWSAVGTTPEAELARYDLVIHMRTPVGPAYGRHNPLCSESAENAAALDARIVEAWSGHPHRVIVDCTDDFMVKARRALELIANAQPACCRAAR